MTPGRIVKWNRESLSGFILPDDRGDLVYFRRGSLCSEDIAPAAGQRVQFIPNVNSRGAMSYHVRILPDEEAPAAGK